MTDKLIIVESPAKANTIKKFLGGNTKVVASMGHVRDLPKSKLAIDIENDFEPQYINIRGKAALINSLKKDAKNAKKVYLATDPDREGEAIAWHLAYLLGIPNDNASTNANGSPPSVDVVVMKQSIGFSHKNLNILSLAVCPFNSICIDLFDLCTSSASLDILSNSLPSPK